jgi:hypothetical protein
VRKHPKTKRNPARKFRRLSIKTIIATTAILAIGAVTVVISRQNANVQEPTQQEGSSPVTKKTDKKLVTVEVGGQQVQVDSQTGKIQELTPEEAQKMAAGLKRLVNKSSEGLNEVHHADGSDSVDLEGRFQNVTVAKVDEDGNLITSCVDTPRAAGAFFGIDPKLIENKDEATPGRLPQMTPATKRN